MRKLMQLTLATSLLNASAFAETALIEVKFFKDWVIKGESTSDNFNLAIKNTGTAPILLAETSLCFEIGQLVTRPLPRNLAEDKEQEEQYQIMLMESREFLKLLPEETHVYEGRKFLLRPLPFSEEIRFTVSIYLGKGAWLDSEPLTLKGVVPDAEEKVATVGETIFPCDLVAVTYKNERWLYVKTRPNEQLRSAGGKYYSICPVSLTNKIRVEPHDGKMLYKIWDGDKSMIYRDGQAILLEGPDENNVFGKWTRERKQKAEADNAEVRRKKAEEKK